MYSIYDDRISEQLARGMRCDPYPIKRFRKLILKRGWPIDRALAELPESIAQGIRQNVQTQFLEQVGTHRSATEGAIKYVSRTTAGFLIESVLLRPKTGRISLCVSSQIGCAAACRFCATGHMGVARNLSAGEILEQVAQANRHLEPERRRVRNIVFMGMGEPMHNESGVQEALRALRSSDGFSHPASRILLSSVGVPEPLLRTASMFPDVNYALSLHSADQPVRESIVPVGSRHDVHELRRLVIELNRIQTARKTVMIEYLMLAGVSDSYSSLSALIRWLAGLRVHVNLIPYNPVSQAPELRGSDQAILRQFGSALRAAGIPTTTRHSLGRDIEAACGQLVQLENRRVARENAHAKTSTSTW